MTDKQIEDFIVRTKVQASDEFSSRVSSAISTSLAERSHIDTLCDKLLKNSKVSASNSFSSRVLAKISNKKQSLLNRGIFALMSVSTIAACLAIAVVSLPRTPTFSVSETDFQEMSDLNNEIYALQTLIVEGEIIEEFKL